MAFSLSAAGAELPPIVESSPVEVQRTQGGVGDANQGGQAGAPAGTLEDRVARLERQFNNQALLEMLNRLQQVQQELQELRGLVEVQNHKINGVEQRQRELYVDIDRRLRQIEEAQAAAAQQTPAASASQPGGSANAAGAATASVMPPAGGTAGQEGDGSPTPDPAVERAAYQRAFNEIQAGNYEKSVTEFQNYLKEYPEGEYAANAQYWLGEAMYVTSRFSDAIAEFNKVLKRYPDSGKAPDALLKLGFSHYELQQWEQASETLKQVVEKYPESTARQLAENRLHQMRIQGR